MKVFARTKLINDKGCGLVPYNSNIASAIHGFHECGVEIKLYNTVNEIWDEFQIGDILLDGVHQVEYMLTKFGIVPSNINYPEVLLPYMGRKIWSDTIDNLNRKPELWGCFVKPVKDKEFVGRVINSPKDLIGCGNSWVNYDIICSEIVDFAFECRAFIYYDEIIDIRPYKGHWSEMKNLNTTLIAKAMEDFKKWEERPYACSLDWGVTRDGKTLLVEQNAAYSLGNYGLYHLSYAKMISAFYSQIYGIKDQLDFRRN